MPLSAAKIKVGDQFTESVVDNLTRTQLVQYAGASGDYNPLHTDDLYTREVAGYPGVFAHGMLTMALAGKALTNLVGDARLHQFSVRFTQQVWPGDSLDVEITIDKLSQEDGAHWVDLNIVTKNQNGQTVLQGMATARIDP